MSLIRSLTIKIRRFATIVSAVVTYFSFSVTTALGQVAQNVAANLTGYHHLYAIDEAGQKEIHLRGRYGNLLAVSGGTPIFTHFASMVATIGQSAPGTPFVVALKNSNQSHAQLKTKALDDFAGYQRIDGRFEGKQSDDFVLFAKDESWPTLMVLADQDQIKSIEPIDVSAKGIQLHQGSGALVVTDSDQDGIHELALMRGGSVVATLQGDGDGQQWHLTSGGSNTGGNGPQKPKPPKTAEQVFPKPEKLSVDTIRADYRVNHHGDLEYDIPLDFNVGIAHHSPALELSYSVTGEAVYTMLGRGWKIAGIDPVTSCTTQKGASSICYMGKFLKKDKAGSYFTIDTNIIQKAKVHFKPNSKASIQHATSVESIEILHGDGSRTILGDSKAYRQVRPKKKNDQSKVIEMLWLPRKHIDRFGNTIHYEFYNFGGQGHQVVPKSIRYGGNTRLNQADNHRIDFIYDEIKNKPTDKKAEFKRLLAIRSFVDDQPSYQYRLGYHQLKEGAPLSIQNNGFLASLAFCSADQVCFAKTQFDYTQKDKNADLAQISEIDTGLGERFQFVYKKYSSKWPGYLDYYQRRFGPGLNQVERIQVEKRARNKYTTIYETNENTKVKTERHYTQKIGYKLESEATFYNNEHVKTVKFTWKGDRLKQKETTQKLSGARKENQSIPQNWFHHATGFAGDFQHSVSPVYTKVENKYDEKTGHLTESITTTTDLANSENQKLVQTAQTEFFLDEQRWMTTQAKTVTVSTEFSGGGQPARRQQLVTRNKLNHQDYTLASSTRYAGEGTLERTNHYEYDSYGNRIQDTLRHQGKTKVHQWHYEKGQYLTKTVNPLGHTESFVIDPVLGQKTAVTDANGLTSQFFYDQAGKLSYSLSPRGVATYYTRRLCNQLCPATATYLEEVRRMSQAGTMVSAPVRRFFDGEARLVREASLSFSGRWVYQDFEYDSRGLVTAESLPYFEGSHPQWQRMQYDAMGRLLSKLNPEGLLVTHHYGVAHQESYDDWSSQQNQLVLTLMVDLDDPKTQLKGRVTLTNAFGHLIQVDELASSSVSDRERLNQYFQDLLRQVGMWGRLPEHAKLSRNFDDLWNLTKQKSIHFQYDPSSRVIARTLHPVLDPERNIDTKLIEVTDTFRYDLAGNLVRSKVTSHGEVNTRYGAFDLPVQTTDAKGQQTSYQYDLLGRVTERHVMSNQGKRQSYQFAYDQYQGQKWLGALMHTAGPEYSEQHQYSAFGEPTQSQYQLKDKNRTFQYVYDAAGRLSQTQYPTGFSLSQQYSDLGYLQGISGEGTNFWQVEDTNAYGQATKARYGNGFSRIQHYSAMGRLTGIHSGLNGYLIQQESYQRDIRGRVTSRSFMVDQDQYQDHFQYDSFSRLAKAVYQKGSRTLKQTDYRYDRWGNLSQIHVDGRKVKSYQYLDGQDPYRLTAFAHQGQKLVLEQDALGNRTRLGGKKISYNEIGQPLTISEYDQDGLKTSEFLYNPSGQRFYQHLKVAEQGSQTTYYAPGQGYEEVQTDLGLIQKIYIGDVAVRTVSQFGQEEKTNTTYLHKDHLGSVRVMTDQAGQVIEHFGFDAFGERQTRSAQKLDLNQRQDLVALGTATTHQGYTGHEMLDDLNLIHMNGRLYDPITSQFTAADPVVADVTRWQSYNKYAYVEQDPINLMDPTGYSSWCCDGNVVDGTKDDHDFSVSINGQPSYGKYTNGNRGYRDNRHGRDNRRKGRRSYQSQPKPKTNPVGAQASTVFLSKGFDFLGEITGVNDVVRGFQHLAKSEYLEAAGSLVQALPQAKIVKGAKFAGKFINHVMKKSPCNCFVAGTLVKTTTGEQPIETLKVGDLVAAKNDQTGEIAYKPILQTFQNTEKPVYTLTLVDGQGKTQETLGVTDNHPFWTQEKGWVQTDELQIGDQLVLQDGTQLAVQSVVLGTEKQATYNFAVADFHTYFVGESGVWVHNAPCDRVTKYDVGTFDNLTKRSTVGDKLDIHHAAQKHPAGKVIDGYDPKIAPSIAVPAREHRRIPTIKGEYSGNARDLLAKDIKDLRNHTNAPNSALQDLIRLNKDSYPSAFSK